ncbi:MAG: helix-turn-helix domain-containing protein [Actinomycetota bacterium]
MPMPHTISQRLRHIRQQQGLTLKQVEIRSRGKWKAVVIGSYERGVRSLSLSKAQELCDFYGVPLSSLLNEPSQSEAGNFESGLTLDLRSIRSQLGNPDTFTHSVFDLASWITSLRNDWNGEVLSLRKSDHETLMIITRKTKIELAQALMNRNFWLTKPDQA